MQRFHKDLVHPGVGRTKNNRDRRQSCSTITSTAAAIANVGLEFII